MVAKQTCVMFAFQWCLDLPSSFSHKSVQCHHDVLFQDGDDNLDAAAGLWERLSRVHSSSTKSLPPPKAVKTSAKAKQQPVKAATSSSTKRPSSTEAKAERKSVSTKVPRTAVADDMEEKDHSLFEEFKQRLAETCATVNAASNESSFTHALPDATKAAATLATEIQQHVRRDKLRRSQVALRRETVCQRLVGWS